MPAPDELLDLLRGLRAHPEHPFRCGYAVIEGEKAIKQFLRSGRTLFGLVGSGPDLPVPATIEMSESDLTMLIGFRPHSPMIALARIPEPVEHHAMRFPAIALESVSDAANVGAIVRTAVGLGVRTIITDPATSSPFLRRAVRTSMGTCFLIEHVVTDDLPALFRDLAAEGRRTLVLEQGPLTIPLNTVTGGIEVIAVGNEGAGCSARLCAAAGVTAHIPMAMEGVSLNVAAAAAIGMAEMWQT